MKVIHLATTAAGGAGRATLRLHESLQRGGTDSSVLVLRPAPATRDLAVFEFSRRLPVRAGRFFRRRWHRWRGAAIRRAPQPPFEQFSLDTSVVGAELAARLPPEAILHLHWVAGFVDYAHFFPLIAHRTVIWTLHDMNPFTGGCHFDNGCGRFTAQCGRCPQLGSTLDADLSREMWRRKHAALSHVAPDRLHIVTPSRWLQAQARASSLFAGRPCTAIPNGLDSAVFSPGDRAQARVALGLPAEAQIMLFVAASLDNPRKGASQLLEALAQVKLPRPFLLSVGAKTPPATPGMPSRHLGSVESDELLAQVYRAADVFVIPSLADNLPNTVVEAMACGTPVVGYAAGGIPELVEPMQTGLLAPTGDPAALARALERLLGDPVLRAHCGATGRARVLQDYTLEIQARRYRQLYDECAAA